MTKPRRKAETKVPLRTVTNTAVTATYVPNWIPVRPGAQDHEAIPSLQGSRRVYRDGRVEAA